MENGRKAEDKKAELFRSRFGAIMSVVGFTVGLGALWGTPMYVAKNGGGLAIALMVGLSVVIAIPLTTLEMTIGRTTRSTIFTGMRAASGRGGRYDVLGWAGVLANILLTCTFVVLTGLTLAYLVKAACGELTGRTVGEHVAMYERLIRDIPLMLSLSAAVVVSFLAVVKQGVQKGIERVCKLMVPSLLAMLVLLAVWSSTLPGALRGLAWLFEPDPSAFTWEMMGQAMWTVFLLAPIGYTSAFAFGSYLPREASDVPATAVITVLSDTAVGILVGLSIFPAMFSAGIDPVSISEISFFGGIPLTFDTLPMGGLLVTVFFLLAFFALYTTGIGLAEGSIASLKDLFGWSRPKAAAVVNAVLFALSAALLTMIGKGVTFRGMGPIDMFQNFVMLLLVPVSGMILVVFLWRTYTFDRFKEDANLGAGLYRVQGWWKVLYAVVVPPVVAYTFYFGLKSFFL